MKRYVVILALLTVAAVSGGVLAGGSVTTTLDGFQVGCSGLWYTFTTTANVIEAHNHVIDVAANFDMTDDPSPYHYVPTVGPGTHTVTIVYPYTLPQGSLIELGEIHAHADDSNIDLINGVFACSDPVPETCGLSIPAGSVVGEAPYAPQVYWEPGKASPGLRLNPGTYIVIGQDASETYYKVVLACQTVWVLKAEMQPSYLPPQNGAPLPTRIVS